MKSAFRNLTAVAALAAIVSFAPITAQANSNCDGPHSYGHGKHFSKMATELGLSDQQKQQIKEIMKKNRPQFEPLIKQKRTEQRALHALIQADKIDEAAIRAQSAKLGNIEADLAVQRAHSGQDFRKVLTPDQAKKFKELHAKRDHRQDAFRDCAGKHFKQDK